MYCRKTDSESLPCYGQRLVDLKINRGRLYVGFAITHHVVMAISVVVVAIYSTVVHSTVALCYGCSPTVLNWQRYSVVGSRTFYRLHPISPRILVAPSCPKLP